MVTFPRRLPSANALPPLLAANVQHCSAHQHGLQKSANAAPVDLCRNLGNVVMLELKNQLPSISTASAVMMALMDVVSVVGPASLGMRLDSAVRYGYAGCGLMTGDSETLEARANSCT